MKLHEMLSNFPDRTQRNEMLMNMAFSHITPPMIVALIQHGIDPNAFASGINFVLQHLVQNGLPEDWEEVVHPVDPDPAKNSEVALTEEDGKVLADDWAIFFGQRAMQEHEESKPECVDEDCQKSHKVFCVEEKEGPSRPKPSRDPLEGSGF